MSNVYLRVNKDEKGSADDLFNILLEDDKCREALNNVKGMTTEDLLVLLETLSNQNKLNINAIIALCGAYVDILKMRSKTSRMLNELLEEIING